MTRGSSRLSFLSYGAVLVAVLLAALAECRAGPVAQADTTGFASAPEITTPLATSVQTSDGTWATIPMGRLDEPLNTFWQLFFRPDGSVAWSNRVEATATATNGGLVLAPAGRSLLVGVRPSVDLKFTPLISTLNGGRSWTDGLITKELAARPDALATTGGKALALINSSAGGEVLADAGSTSHWRTLVTYDELARGRAGGSCGLGSLTSVGYLGAQPVVGGSCSQTGVVGLFARDQGDWRLVGPPLPRSLDGLRAEVLGLKMSDNTTSALVAVTGGRGTELLADWSGPGAGWSASSPLAISRLEHVASFGVGRGRSLFVLLQGASGAERLALAQAEGTAWKWLPSPPAGTETVAFDANGSTDAIVANGTKFSAWSLKAVSMRWAENQVMRVAIQYGSSS
jgi:hypothetical protein